MMSLTACIVFAQRDFGAITGTVTDSSDSVVTGAKIAIIEQATGVRSTVESDSSGTYIRTLLKPGVYTIEVEAPGFRKGVQREILLNGGDRVGVNLVLTVGDVTQTIEINSVAPLLQTENTTLGVTIQAKSMSELPLGGQRKFTFLATSAPGVVPAEQGARDSAGGGFSANGVRSNGQNNFLLNGVDNNVNVIDFINQTSYVIGPALDAIGEMRVVTNGYSAEYGRGAGGVVNVTIKSGTNEIHGAVFEYLQNDKLNSNRWEQNRVGTPKGAFRQNQYGVAIGGPIVRNRTFWFADWQGTRISSAGGAVPGLGNVFVTTIPKAAHRGGDFSSNLGAALPATDAMGRSILSGAIYDMNTSREVGGRIVRDQFPGNIIPAARFDPAAKKLIDLYPNPNQNLLDRLPGNNYTAVTKGNQTNDQFDIRIDHRLTDKDSLFGSVSWSKEDKLNSTPFAPKLDGAGFNGQTETNLGRNAMVSWTRVWNPTILTETRAAFSRLVTQRTQANSDQNLFKEFGIGGLDPTGPLNGGLPNLQPEGYTTVGGAEWLPTLEYSNVWDFVQNVSINKGKHAHKFGYEFRPIKFPFYQVPTPRGTFRFRRNRTGIPEGGQATGDGLASFLLGYPADSTITTQNFISSEKSAHGFYWQDDWKVTSKLTVNVGVRYELFSPISERFGRQSNYVRDSVTLFIPKGKDQDAPLPPNFASSFPTIKVSRGEVDKYLIGWDKTNWAPRIGLAYQVMPKMVVRAAFGMFYGGEENQGGNPNRGEGVPFNQTQNLNLVSDYQQGHPFLNRFSDGWPLNVFNLPANISFRGVAPNYRNPLVNKWNVTVQRDLGGNMALEVSYIASKGLKQLINWDPNIPVNSPLPNQNQDARRAQPFLRGGIQETSSFGRSAYHGLAAKLEKRFSQGISYTAVYTWGHALADTGTPLSGSTGFGIRDITCGFRCEYSSAPWDIRQRFNFIMNYELPFGRGRQFGANLGRAADLAVGGWQVNSVVTFSTGQPFTLQSLNAVGSFNGTNVRPDAVDGKDPFQAPSGGRTPDQWWDITAVKSPAPGTVGNVGNQTHYGPGIRNLDFSLFKDFRITERFSLQFRNEYFNMTNTPRFAVAGVGNQQGNSNFGRISQTLPGSQRYVQFALRLKF